jgi:hypothetical protein
MTFDPRYLLALVLPIVAACSSVTTGEPLPTGSSSGSPPTCAAGSAGGAAVPSPPRTSIDLPGACKHLFEQRNAYSAACLAYPDPAPDEAAFESLCADIATAPGSLVTVADVDGCANQLGTLVCAGPEMYPGCFGGQALLFPDGARTGAFPAGSPCVAGLQCASGHCAALAGDCGACMRARANGESCTTAGDVCLDSVCTNGSCATTQVGVGVKCFQYGGSSACNAGLVCKTLQGTEGDGFCAPLGNAGDACQGAFQCVPSLACDDGRCVPWLPNGACCEPEKHQCVSGCIDGICRQRTENQKEGESCQIDSCTAGLVCDGFVCTSQSLLAKGQQCWAGGGYTGTCGDGLGCDVLLCGSTLCATGACVDLPAIGAPCIGIGGCGAGAVCIGFNPSASAKGICTALGGEGGACPCANDLVCSGGKCVTFGTAMCQ